MAIASTALQNADEYRPDGQVTFEQIDPITVNTYQYDSSGNLTGTTPREVKRWKKVVALTPDGQTQFSQQQQISISMNRWALGQTQLLESLMAQPLNANDLEHLTDAVTEAYRKTGWVVQAYIPRQDLGGRELTVQIIETIPPSKPSR